MLGALASVPDLDFLVRLGTDELQADSVAPSASAGGPRPLLVGNQRLAAGARVAGLTAGPLPGLRVGQWMSPGIPGSVVTDTGRDFGVLVDREATAELLDLFAEALDLSLPDLGLIGVTLQFGETLLGDDDLVALVLGSQREDWDSGGHRCSHRTSERGRIWCLRSTGRRPSSRQFIREAEHVLIDNQGGRCNVWVEPKRFANRARHAGLGLVRESVSLPRVVCLLPSRLGRS